jgi:hypothetical protein
MFLRNVGINVKILSTNCYDVKPLVISYEMPVVQDLNFKYFMCGCNIDGFT